MAPVLWSDIMSAAQSGSHTYEIDFELPWAIGTVPNGGYVTSAFLLVARRHMESTHARKDQSHVISLHLEFMRRTSVGKAVFKVRDVKLGARTTNLHITLLQENNGELMEEVAGYLMISNLVKEEGLTLNTGYKLYPEPVKTTMEALRSETDLNYAVRARDPFHNFRRAANNLQMHLLRPEKKPKHFPKALIDQWITFRPQSHPGQPARFTNDALGFVVDVFPQMIEQYVNQRIEDGVIGQELPKQLVDELLSRGPRVYWYPTLCLNLDVKKLLPKEGAEFLFVRIQAHKIVNGRFDLHVEVLDEEGDIVAISTHSSLVVDASRNTTRKSKKTSASKL